MSKTSRRPNRAARHAKPPARGWRPSTNLYWLIAVVAAAVLIGATFLIGGKDDQNAAGPIEVGQTAPAVSGRDVITGRTIDSRDLAGSDVLYYLNEGVMCQACLVQIQALQQHIAHLKDRHMTLVSITNDDTATLRQAAQDYKITTPLLSDSSREITRSFGVLGGIPAGVGMHGDTANHTFVLVDRTGTVRYVTDYPSMWVDVSALLDDLPAVS